jgi:hypothetical protein
MLREQTRAGRPVTRRDFLRNTGAGLAAASASPGVTKTTPAVTAPRFTPPGGLTQISPNLYLFRDTCNVNVLKDRDRAMLIGLWFRPRLEATRTDGDHPS